jgi:peptidoglycan/LPS O-acetylase OafA/YrhL
MIVQDMLVVLILLAIGIAAMVSADDLPIYLLFIPLVAVLSYDGRLAQLLFGNRFIYDLGLISYSLYLLHPLFVSLAVLASRYFGGTKSSYVIASLISIAVIWLLSKLSYRLIEMPGRRLISAIVEPRRRRSVEDSQRRLERAFGTQQND